jgi:hypothetical protein
VSVAHSPYLKLEEAVVVFHNTEFIKVYSAGSWIRADVQLGAHDNVVPVYVRMEPALGIGQGRLDPVPILISGAPILPFGITEFNLSIE